MKRDLVIDTLRFLLAIIIAIVGYALAHVFILDNLIF